MLPSLELGLPTLLLRLLLLVSLILANDSSPVGEGVTAAGASVAAAEEEEEVEAEVVVAVTVVAVTVEAVASTAGSVVAEANPTLLGLVEAEGGLLILVSLEVDLWMDGRVGSLPTTPLLPSRLPEGRNLSRELCLWALSR